MMLSEIGVVAKREGRRGWSPTVGHAAVSQGTLEHLDATLRALRAHLGADES